MIHIKFSISLKLQLMESVLSEQNSGWRSVADSSPTLCLT